MMIEIFKQLKSNFAHEIEVVGKQYSAEPFICTEEPLILK